MNAPTVARAAFACILTTTRHSLPRHLSIGVLTCLTWAVASTSKADLITIRSDSTWRTTTPQPGTGWNTDPLFDDSDAAGWQNAFQSPAGNNIWHTSNLSGQAPNQAWFRHTFMLDSPVLAALAIFFFDDDGEAYVNGQLVVADPGGGASRFSLILDPGLFQIGENLVAVHGIDRIGPFNNVAVMLNLTTVPEPSTLALIVVGAAILTGCGWRRSRGNITKPSPPPDPR